MLITGHSRNMTPVLTDRTTSRAGRRFAKDEPPCRLSPAEEMEWLRFQAWRAAGLTDAAIRKLVATPAAGAPEAAT